MRRILLLVGACLICVSITPALIARSTAATTKKLAWVSQKSNRFRNFDFTSQSDSASKVDWPVDFIYYNNASISTVQSEMYDFLGCQSTGICASPMYMHYSTNSGSSYGWTTSGNMKQSLSACTPAGDLHQRIYAPNGRFYSTNWGYYIIGTTHFDYQELCGGWSGKSEDAEKAVCTLANFELGYSGGGCWYDSGPNLGNAMANQLVNGHWWKNDGNATYALVT